MKKLSLYISLLCLILTAGACKNKTGGPATASSELTDDALMDTVQHRTFLYFWEGAEPNSGLAPERYHVDGVYPQNDANVVTSGGSGFGIMAILAGIDRGYVTREEGLARMERIVSFLEKADRFHGAYPHWWYGDTPHFRVSVSIAFFQLSLLRSKEIPKSANFLFFCSFL